MNKKFLLSLTIIAYFFAFSPIFANDLNRGFIPNNGQWNPEVLFRTDIPSGKLFLEKQQLTWVFYDSHALEDLHHQDKQHGPSDKLDFHSIKMRFEGSHEPTEIQKENPAETGFNFLLGDDKSKWAGGLKAYQDVKYLNLYPGIDFHILHNEKGIKYEMLLKPGADASSIKIRYEGANDIRILNYQLQITTGINTFGEEKPIAWQIIQGHKVEVECAFKLTNDQLGYELGTYRKDLPLIIDPQFIFSTYSGSTADNWGYTACFDEFGNGYSGGIVFDVGFPTTAGAYQQAFKGGDFGLIAGFDIGILKYSPDGTKLLYATYVGGSGNEFPHSIIVNQQNELLIFGLTSSSDFPVSSSAYDYTFKGGQQVYVLDGELLCKNGVDMFVCRLSEDGSKLLASTFIGGSDNDGANLSKALDYNYGDVSRGAINVDQNNDIIVVSSTSSKNFPITGDAFQKIYGGGDQDGVILKLNNELDSLLYSSYLGGSGDDGIYSLAFGPKNEIVITGGTNSQNLPTSIGSISKKYNGGLADGFVAVISQTDHQLKYCTYFGTPSYDQSYLVQSDKKGNIFLFGQTESPGNAFIRNVAFFDIGGKQFISKLKPDLSDTAWSTAFGNAYAKPDLVPSAFQVDVCNKIYISGWGGESVNSRNPGTTKGLKTTPDAIRSISDGNDFYLMVIDDQATKLLYGTFLGIDKIDYTTAGDHVDGGTSRFDPRGIIYQSACAGCWGQSDFPTTPGAWSRTNKSNKCNNALLKFDFEYPITIAAFNFNPPPLSCDKAIINYQNTSINATKFQWFINGKKVSETKNLTHEFTQAGSYNIMLVAENPGSCNVADTVSKTTQIKTPNNLNAEITYEKFGVCSGVDVTLNGSGSDKLKWYFGKDQTSEDPQSNIIIPYNDTLKVMLVAYSGICADTTYVTEIIKGLGDYYQQNDANAFSPNGDGKNDCFSPALQLKPKPYDESFLECSDLIVFNRWGNKIFDSTKNGKSSCWDGKTDSGELLPEGVYFYTFYFLGKEYAGLVHLRMN